MILFFIEFREVIARILGTRSVEEIEDFINENLIHENTENNNENKNNGKAPKKKQFASALSKQRITALKVSQTFNYLLHA